MPVLVRHAYLLQADYKHGCLLALTEQKSNGKIFADMTLGQGSLDDGEALRGN